MYEAKISVIIPCYNAEKYIHNSVESIVSQSYKNYEIVIVDDCSIDDSFNQCKKLSKKYPNIKVIRNEKNMGQTYTRNRGIQSATGDWMIFLDADDIIKDGVFEQYMAVAKTYNPDIIFAGYETIEADCKITEYKADIKSDLYSNKMFGSFLFDKISMNVLSCIGSKMYNLNFIRTRKKTTGNDILTNYDMAFVIDSLISCKNIFYLDSICYTYILRAGSITYSYRKDMYNRITMARRRMKEYFYLCGCSDSKNFFVDVLQCSLIKQTLLQEIEYKMGYRNFKSRVIELSRMDSVKETYKGIQGETISAEHFAYKIFMKLVLKKKTLILFLVLFCWRKIRKWIK